MTYKINLHNLIETLILFVLIITPIFSFQESMSLIFGGIVNNSAALTSPYIKGLKDLSFILIILISFIIIMKKNKINYITLCSIFVFNILIFIPAYLHHDNIILFLAGIRWFMPFIVVISLTGYIDKSLLKKISLVLFWLFVIHIAIQVIQLFFSESYFGADSLGLSIRNPGIFFMPSTAGTFAILVLFFSKFYMDKKLERKIFFLIPLSILLTASGTGIGVYIVFMSIYYLKKKYFIFMPFILILLAIILIFTLDTLSGRSGLLEESFGPRLVMFHDTLTGASYFPSTFGNATSTGYLIANKFGLNFKMIATDSWFATVIANLGLINSFIIVILLIFLFVILIIRKNKEQLIFLIMYSLFSATTVFTESFPANLIFAVLLSYYIKPKKDLFETVNNPQ